MPRGHLGDYLDRPESSLSSIRYSLRNSQCQDEVILPILYRTPAPHTFSMSQKLSYDPRNQTRPRNRPRIGFQVCFHSLYIVKCQRSVLLALLYYVLQEKHPDPYLLFRDNWLKSSGKDLTKYLGVHID